jgi:hypothetical protein
MKGGGEAEGLGVVEWYRGIKDMGMKKAGG